jgi:hypothetical protein
MRIVPGSTAFAVMFALVSLPSAASQASPLERGVWLVGGTGRIHETHDIDGDSRRFVLDLNPQVG